MSAAHLLTELATDISNCRVCDRQGIRVSHIAPMERGEGTTIMAIGIEPGKTEVRSAKAFSGAAGKRLIEWLQDAGVGSSREEILERCHLTSLVKCHVVEKRHLPQVVRNCFSFLERQISIVQPKICLTLGQEPLAQLFGCNKKLDDVVGHVWEESTLGQTFIPILPDGCQIIPLPHPSPLSRWLNHHDNKKKLSVAIAVLREALK